MEELKELELLDEGEMVDIPDLELEDLIEANSLSVIVRCLNPYVHKVGGLVKALPPIWGLEDRVQGRAVGVDRIQVYLRCGLAICTFQGAVVRQWVDGDPELMDTAPIRGVSEEDNFLGQSQRAPNPHPERASCEVTSGASGKGRVSGATCEELYFY